MKPWWRTGLVWAAVWLLSSSVARAEYCTEGRKVMLAGINWQSGEFLTAVVQEILERGFGCLTDTLPGNSITLEQALSEDDVQILAEEWVNRSDVWRKAADAGKVLGIGHVYSGAVEGWAVPAYLVSGDATRHLAPAAPDLKSVAQLSDPKYIALFADPEQPTRGRFLNCPAGWTCELENTAKFDAYGLGDTYVNFKPGTGPAMDAAIVSAYLQGLPVLFYYWSPSAIAGRLALQALSEPPYTPDCLSKDNPPGVKPTRGCTSAAPIVAYGVSSRFAAGAPEIVAILNKAVFSLPHLNANLASMDQAQRSAREQAVLFLENYRADWQPWVSPATAARIDASLTSKSSAVTAIASRATASFPKQWLVSIRQPVNAAVTSLVTTHGAGFRAAAHALLSLIVVLDSGFAFVPWWAVIAALVGLTWLGTRRPILSISVGVLMFAIGMLGLWDQMLQTLTLMLLSSALALLIGLPLGIVVAKSVWCRRLMIPTLDVMQTMPSFVYLIPALMLFGLGKVPAIIATVIYAVPPMIRLTALGIDQVHGEIKEAATAFGVTPLQMLLTVELPLAKSSIMAGVNQTIMLALSMVVVASMIGARGLGEQVLTGIQTLDVGKGLEAGIGIVLLAIVLDRVTQGLGRLDRARDRARGAYG